MPPPPAGPAPAGAALCLAVAIGGALGSAGRWALDLVLAAPAATLLVNVSGAFALAALLTAAPLLPRLRDRAAVLAGLGPGLLGGWTTFSAVTVEVVGWWREGAVLTAAAYVAASVLAGAAAVLAGVAAVRWAVQQGEPT